MRVCQTSGNSWALVLGYHCYGLRSRALSLSSIASISLALQGLARGCDPHRFGKTISRRPWWSSSASSLIRHHSRVVITVNSHTGLSGQVFSWAVSVPMPRTSSPSSGARYYRPEMVKVGDDHVLASVSDATRAILAADLQASSSRSSELLSRREIDDPLRYWNTYVASKLGGTVDRAYSVLSILAR